MAPIGPGIPEGSEKARRLRQSLAHVSDDQYPGERVTDPETRKFLDNYTGQWTRLDYDTYICKENRAHRVRRPGKSIPEADFPLRTLYAQYRRDPHRGWYRVEDNVEYLKRMPDVEYEVEQGPCKFISLYRRFPPEIRRAQRSEIGGVEPLPAHRPSGEDSATGPPEDAGPVTREAGRSTCQPGSPGDRVGSCIAPHSVGGHDLGGRR